MCITPQSRVSYVNLENLRFVQILNEGVAKFKLLPVLIKFLISDFCFFKEEIYENDYKKRNQKFTHTMHLWDSSRNQESEIYSHYTLVKQ